jgi:hypothetical protein
VSHGIDASVQAMEPTDLRPVRDRGPNQAKRFELLLRDDSMLPKRPLGQRPLLVRSYFVQHGTSKYERTVF